jgi:hypothetical protein
MSRHQGVEDEAVPPSLSVAQGIWAAGYPPSSISHPEEKAATEEQYGCCGNGDGGGCCGNGDSCFGDCCGDDGGCCGNDDSCFSGCCGDDGGCCGDNAGCCGEGGNGCCGGNEDEKNESCWCC